MDIKAVIFDWDGTLVDSVDHIADSLHQAATELGYPELEREAYRDIIGLGMIEALGRLYPGIDRDEMLAIRERYAAYFFSKVTTPQNVFEGMADVVSDIRRSGLGCSVATGKSRRGLESALTSSGLGAHFDITRCADETRSKPDPKMLEEILEFYGLEPADAVMIGDTRYDLEMAQRIGMPAIGVEWGVHKRDVLGAYDPHAIVSSVPDLRVALGL
ncbi:HAD-IA family hydrolase [Marinobacter salinisoli]|uniref:HAD-IA family hydrolase n=1 Tax=Marinobacter salinisoli TaxID=2769486 RepID=A0ABX7MTB4_9GAMM|nr:HAD-IA family hydrolase [Marinobacter salinisoli]QSP93483.1 HAD-IA family hydrolase [Marinobacter salinisoli]